MKRGMYVNDPRKSRTIRTKSLRPEDLDNVLTPDDAFAYHTVIDESTGKEYRAYLEPWYWDCLDAADINDAKGNCSGDEDCVSEYLWATVEEKAEKRAKRDRWSRVLHLESFPDESDFGESLFLREKKKVRQRG